MEWLLEPKWTSKELVDFEELEMSKSNEKEKKRLEEDFSKKASISIKMDLVKMFLTLIRMLLLQEQSLCMT